jgi:tetratricopeptide (TPR) repeat protein
MAKLRWGLWTLALLAAGMSGVARADVSPQLQAEGRAFETSRASGNCDEGVRMARRMATAPDFKDLPDDVRTGIWMFVVSCDVNVDRDYKEALEDARQGTSLPDVRAELWTVRLQLGEALGKPDDFVDAVEVMAERQPTALRLAPLRSLTQFAHSETAARDTNRLRRFYAALERADYVPPDPSEPADLLWLGAARLAADAGENEHAGKLLARMTDVGALMLAKLDARFAVQVAARPDHFDLPKAAEAQRAHDEAAMRARPDLLVMVWQVARDRETLGKFTDALAVVQDALDQVDRAGKGGLAFKDQGAMLHRMWDAKSGLLLDLGRFDEAVAAMRRGAKFDEDGRPNVSQTLDLAYVLNRTGRPADALAEVAWMGPKSASPYGLMVLHSQRACADAHLGRMADAEAELAYLTAHERDGPGGRRYALLCLHKLDELAADVIAQLNDPDEREGELLDLSDLTVNGAMTPERQQEIDVYKGLLARADVQSAVAKVGHTESVPLCGCGMVSAPF